MNKKLLILGFGLSLISAIDLAECDKNLPNHRPATYLSDDFEVESLPSDSLGSRAVTPEPSNAQLVPTRFPRSLDDGLQTPPLYQPISEVTQDQQDEFTHRNLQQAEVLGRYLGIAHQYATPIEDRLAVFDFIVRQARWRAQECNHSPAYNTSAAFRRRFVEIASRAESGVFSLANIVSRLRNNQNNAQAPAPHRQLRYNLRPRRLFENSQSDPVPNRAVSRRARPRCDRQTNQGNRSFLDKNSRRS